MKKLIQLQPDDNVGIAVVALPSGDAITLGDRRLTVNMDIGQGHKVALIDLAAGDKVRRNNMVIGSATQPIAVGDHVHLHNLRSDYIPTLNQHYQDREVTP